ncbi:MAG: amidohydrolase family protein [Intrasporangiaceae bacterium]|nr:amidohydrolase family protein [Intrasporangiaceae bacterium]
MTATTYWSPRALLPEGVRKRVRLTVEDGLITAVGVGVRPEPNDVVLEGLVRPGFANAHSHAFHRALRGRTHADGGTFWTWRERMYAVTTALDPLTYQSLARGAFAEMVLAGYTVVGEFHYLHHGPGGVPYPDPNAMGRALLTAAEEAGIRITLLDTVYLAGGLSASGHEPLDETQLRFADESVEAWQQRVTLLAPTTTARHGAAIHSVRAVARESLGEVARYAAAGLGRSAAGPAPLHIHLSEQPGENIACEQFYGLTPTALLHAEGVLSDGARLCIGSDQHAVVDPFEEVRAVELHDRLDSLERGRFSPEALDPIGSAHGYASVGWPEGGTLRQGALADFIAVRLDSPRTAGAYPDQVVFSAGAPDVTDVIVAGRHVVAGGVHALGPVGPLLAAAIARVQP